jgi:predicted glycosyltransferase
VMATTGGGEDGFELLENFITASAEAPWQGMVVAGPMTPEPRLKGLQELADQHRVPLQSFVPSMSRLFLAVDAVVCMGGYNTLAEAISKGVSVVCVPRQAPRAEQAIRAKALERLGLLRMLNPARICRETLRAAVDEALKIPREAVLDKARQTLSFDGAYRAAGQLVRLAGSKGTSTRGVRKAPLANLDPVG